MRTFVAALLLVVALGASAQDRREIRQILRDLSSPGVLMDISAHPDDEDGATLAYYRMKRGVHTYSVLFTRGEGGQNEKGSELYEQLGVIRSEETRTAGRILGAEVEFLNFPDFGYSKTATEAFRIWGGQREVLRRLVYMIRRLKPDVLFSNHNTWGGHGHHQAVAITAIAAFDAAADATMFPEQLREPGVSVWQPRKLYLRVFGSLQGQGSADVTHNLEEMDDIRGTAYIDVATAALREHRTQGLDRADLRAFARGRSAYKLARASSLFRQDSTDFFAGILPWDEEPLQSMASLAALLTRIPSDATWDSLVSAASDALPRVDSLVYTPAGNSPLGRRILDRWHERLQLLAATAAGVEASPKLGDTVLVPGQRVHLTVRPTSSRGSLKLGNVTWTMPQGWSVGDDEAERSDNSRSFILTVGAAPRLTFPRAEHLYQSIEDGTVRIAHIAYSIDGRPLTLDAPIDADIASPHLLSTSPPALWAQPEDARRGISFTCSVTNMFPHKTAGKVTVSPPAGWKGTGFAFALEREGDSEEGKIQLVAPSRTAEGDYHIHLKTDNSERQVTVRLGHLVLPPTVLVGLVSSHDSTLATSLREMRVRTDTLSDDMLASGDLHRYHTIVVDIRAYLLRAALKEHNARLLEYVKEGGNLVVMYQREREWKPEYAPYPFTVSRERVTMEDAPVRVLQESHPLMCWPNVITPRDWEGWTQERLVYLPKDVPREYARIVTTHDPDEPEADTGYLCAAYGKGSYIYTSYVWYRQLKDRHPGAMRCLANMISYPLRPR